MMKINKNYPLSLAVDSLLHAFDARRRPAHWFFGEEDLPPARRPDFKVLEQDDLYEVKFLLPGFDKKEISVTLEGSDLTVSASGDKEAGDGSFGKGSFSHTIEVPETCDKEKLTAKLDSGILKIVLPKREKPKAVRIKIG